jgi:hypothetical protein
MIKGFRKRSKLIFMSVMIMVSFVFYTTEAWAATYYFSSINGNDSNLGNSMASPWKSIAKMQATINNLQPGDIIYLEKGSVWYESKLVLQNKSGSSASPISFEAYGSGKKPVISGGKNVSGTFSASGNLWTSSSASFVPHGYIIMPGGILIDNKFYPIARHPNTTYYTTGTRGTKTNLTDNSQSWTVNELVGGQVSARCVTWAWSTGNITSNTSNTINFQAFPDFNLGSEDPTTYYFLQNIERGADVNGEWCYNNDNIKVYSNSNLNSKAVEFSMVDTIVKVNNCNYINFSGIEFRMANSILMDIQTGSRINISDCSFRVAGFSAMDINGTANFDVTRCNFEYSHGNGITADNLNVAHLTENKFYMTPGTEGHWNYPSASKRVGASITSYYHTGPIYVRNNEFDSVMIAMQSHWSDAPLYFERNIIRDYGIICGDIAAVYMGGDWKLEIKKYIRKNIFINAHKSTNTTVGAHAARYVHGIYWDYDVHGAICDSNTFINSNAVVYSNRAYGNRFNGNVVYNGAKDLQGFWRTNIYLDSNIGGQSGPKLDTFNYNTFVYGEYDNERAFLWHNVTEGGFELKNNKYINPFSSGIKIHREVDKYVEVGNYSASEYCSRTGLDCSSSTNPLNWNYSNVSSLISKDKFVKVVYNASNSPDYIYLDAAYIDLDGQIYSDSVLVSPYYSKVLFYHHAVANRPPHFEGRQIEIRQEDFTGTTVSDLNAVDPDGQPVTYAIVGGDTYNLFYINGSNQLAFKSPVINYTGNPVYNIIIEASDNGSPQLKTQAVFRVSLVSVINPVQNNAPVINNQTFETSFDEQTPAVLGTISASDPDEGQSITYQIMSGNTENLFAVNNVNGELTMLNFPTNQVPVLYQLTVKVTDNAQNSLYDEATININIAASNLVFYIDPKNEDDLEANGTYEHPFTNWSDVNWKENGKYLQKRGTTSHIEKILITASNVTLGDYGNGDKPILISSTDEYAIKAMGKHHVTINNLIIEAENAIGCIYFIGAACEENAIINCEMSGSDYGLRIIDGKSFTVKYNVFMNEVDGIYSIAEYAEIYYNVFKGNYKAINLSSYSASAKIYNNVFYDNRQGVSTSYAEINLYNNIFYLTQASDQAINHKLDKLVSNNNIFYPEQQGFLEIEEKQYNTLAEYQNTYGLDLKSFAKDPLFLDVYISNFAVEKESKAIDAGKIVGLTEDFYGQVVPFGGGPDIGLVELNTTIDPSSYGDHSSDLDNLVSCYPNPSQGRFNLTIEDDLNGEYEIAVCTLTGKRLYSQIMDTDGMFMGEIDISDSPKGMYLLSVKAKDKVYTQKIIIQ